MKPYLQRNPLAALLQRCALLGAAAAAAPSQALEFQFDEWRLNVDTTLGYSAQWRTESRDDFLENSVNANDGNNNFDSGSLTSSKANMILEVGGDRGGFSFFIRGDAIYDYVYADSSSDLSRRNYRTYNGGIFAGGDLQRGEYPDRTIDKQGKRLRLLDAFIIQNFPLGDMYGSLKVGRQIISWGGSLFYPGINGLQNPNDAAAALAPGVEAKEIFLPTTAVDFKMNLTDQISAEAYVKLEWKETLQAGVGSYLSTSDFTGPGAQSILLGPLGAGQAGGQDSPGKPAEQWGTALRYMFDSGWNTELAYARSHANIPGAFIFIDLAGPNSFAKEFYQEDIPSWNFSVSGNIGEAEVYADIFYSDDMPFVDLTPTIVVGASGGPGLVQANVTTGDYWQVTAGMSDLYTAFKWLSPSIALNAEIIYQGNDVGKSRLQGTPYVVTDDAWGYQFALTPRYFNVIQGMDGTLSLAFRHDVKGYGNSIALGNGLEEDQKKASITATGNYLGRWEFKATYAWFWDEKEQGDYLIKDRDNFSVSVKYRF
ncbi:MAG: DUF1302 family protein [Halioglobus sp.]|nr:DUF1302 family protein [Halioglobus sp.]